MLRRPPAAQDRTAAAKTKLAAAPAIAALSLDGVSSAFVSLIARREADGRFTVVSVDQADTTQLLRAAKHLKS